MPSRSQRFARRSAGNARTDNVANRDGGKEQIGGFWVITAPDLDAALDWGRKATRASRFPVEVRPFMG